MKINEMQLDEFIPITKKGRALRRAEKAGAADVKQTVDDLETEFAGVLGTQGKKFKTATVDDVVSFLKSKKVNTARIDTTQPMNPKRINQVFTALVKDKVSGANLADPTSNAATPNAPAATPTASPQKPGVIDKVKNMFKGKSQAAPAPAATTPRAPAAAKPNAASGDTYEKAKGDVRKVQSGTKPLPTQMAAGVSADIAKLAKGDKESGVAAADKIMKFAQRGMDVAKLQQAWVANAKAGERFLTQSVYFAITKMLKEHNLSWSDLGIRVHLLEGTNKLFGISLKER